MEPIVIIDNKEVSAQPGMPVVVGLRVKNTGTRNTAYDLSVVGVPESWASISPSQVRPKEREADAATAVLTITPPIGGDAPAGAVPFGVKATSTVDGSSAVDEGVVLVGGAGGLDVVAGVTQRRGRWRAKFDVHLENTGNDDVRVALVPFDASDEIRLEVDRQIVQLASKASTTVTLKAKMRSPRLRGAPTVAPIVLAVHGHERGTDMKRPGQQVPPGSDPLHREIPLMVTQLPILTKAVTVVAGLAILALVALVAYRSFLYNESDPAIVAPTQGPDLIHEPQPAAISVRWDPVSGADAYVIQLESTTDGTQVLEPFGSDKTSHVISGLDPATEYEVTLTALVGELRGFSTSFTERPGRAELASPTITTAEPTGQEAEYRVAWTFDGGDGSFSFNILVDGQLRTNVRGLFETFIGLQPGSRVLTVEVVSDDDPSQRGLSEPRPVEVPAPVVEDPETGDGGTGGDGGTDGDDGGSDGDGGTEGDTGGDGNTTGGTGDDGTTGNPPVVGPGSEAAAIVADKPFLVVLSIGFQTAEGGLDEVTAPELASTFEVLVDLRIGPTDVVAIPASQFDLTLIGTGSGSGTPSGWIVGAATASEADARALCADPGWDENAALAEAKASWINGCTIVQVS